MKQVAEHLRTHAIGLRANGDFDSFARSAFNRFYYSVFVEVRELVREVQGQSVSIAHRSMPEYIVGGFRIHIAKIIDNAFRAKLITESERHRFRSTVIAMTGELRNALASGYTLRIVADYEAAPRSIFNAKGDIELSGTPGAEAAKWVSRTSMSVAQIRKIWKQING